MQKKFFKAAIFFFFLPETFIHVLNYSAIDILN